MLLLLQSTEFWLTIDWPIRTGLLATVSYENHEKRNSPAVALRG